jgi:hypothetical protein
VLPTQPSDCAAFACLIYAFLIKAADSLSERLKEKGLCYFEIAFGRGKILEVQNGMTLKQKRWLWIAFWTALAIVTHTRRRYP